MDTDSTTPPTEPAAPAATAPAAPVAPAAPAAPVAPAAPAKATATVSIDYKGDVTITDVTGTPDWVERAGQAIVKHAGRM